MDDQVAEPFADRPVEPQIHTGLELVVVERDLTDRGRDALGIAVRHGIGEVDEVRRRGDGDLRAGSAEVGDSVAQQARGGARHGELAAQIERRTFAERVLHGAHAEDVEADLRAELGRGDGRTPRSTGEHRVDNGLRRQLRPHLLAQGGIGARVAGILEDRDVSATDRMLVQRPCHAVTDGNERVQHRLVAVAQRRGHRRAAADQLEGLMVGLLLLQ